MFLVVIVGEVRVVGGFSGFSFELFSIVGEVVWERGGGGGGGGGGGRECGGYFFRGYGLEVVVVRI